MAERKKRTSYYVGPKERITREDLPRYEATGEWVAEIKKDGVWCLMTITNGIITALESRTGLPLQATMLGQRVAKTGTGLLAGELVADMVDGDEGIERTGKKRMHFFEPLEWNGLDLRDRKLEERREALVMVFETFTNSGDYTYLVERRASGFLAWYDSVMGGKVIGSGAEGLVLKKRGTTGRAINADGKIDSWRRCKPLHTVDYVVIGPDGTGPKGTPKVALGLYKLTRDGRRVVKAMSPTWPSGMDLRPGMVVEVEGAEVFPSGAVRHGHVKRVRSDKRAIDCTFESAVES
jgi:ATP-dependent DNA ligase